MKIPYVQDSSEGLSPEDAAIYERIKLRRGGSLLPLDKALFHSPKLADGWNSLLGAVRTQGILPTDIREIIICRVALNNKAWFEWHHHAPILQSAPGFTSEMMKVVESIDLADPDNTGPDSSVLNPKQLAALRYADSMTRQIDVPTSIFESLKTAGFDDQEIVEMTITCGAYNMVSRFLVALDVGEMNGKSPLER
ncbi:uncharacterized protein PV06_08746 [Exophiala oligosperma]|uniref:Carboxymuconolactone decarboxylase-like domain-containing protein n=1 Tax=Exophiala oligosperma TaxID=215243 RepID=A0A0D2D905_9EURO|nr:uncharacterized protein PV06_08746 [Exophiala oligosperma]KIW38925.1 hypothetical protein PV06_08746 [Exophiala oligosperma]